MIRLFLNGLGASAGAGLTYLYNVVPRLSAYSDVHTTIAVQPRLRQQFEIVPNVTVADVQAPALSAVRFAVEQRELPKLIRGTGSDVLISAGNFALRNPPIPQILLSGNSLYTSTDFDRDLRGRHEYSMWLDTRIKGIFARRSVHWSDCTIAPTQAFADELKRWTGKDIFAIHHGFDRELFFRDHSPLTDEMQRKLACPKGWLKLLFVSHYNYYRNFETLLRAIPLVREKLGGLKVQLFLTCKLEAGKNPGAYRTGRASELIRQLAICDEVVELGTVPYQLLHRVYRACDIYVTPAYTETFAHPLVEAMSCGLPIVASDLAVHREVAAGAACYFPRFSPEALAENIVLVATSPALAANLSAIGRQRSFDFSWKKHVEKVLEITYSIRRRAQSRASMNAA